MEFLLERCGVFGSERRSEVEEGTGGRVRGMEGWGSLGHGEDGGTWEQRSGQAGAREKP